MSQRLNRVLALTATTAVTLGGAVVAATPASAASVWDAVAACESGGNWSINTGNGYYGGLQFSSSTWRAFGGTEFAANAHQATKAQQITVAQRTLAVQGPGAWPTCSIKAGLTKANGGAASAASASTTSTAARATETTSRSAAKASTPVKKAATPKRATTVKATESTGKRFVTVKSGDTLAKLARVHGVAGGWESLWSLNKAEVSNPNVIFVGQKLAIG
ncbi:MAG: transglycosylase family protein [Actinomycetes bacterium]